MKKSELMRIIREELSRINESVEFKVKSLSWDSISKNVDGRGNVHLPTLPGVSDDINTEKKFNDWKINFIKSYGDATIEMWKPSSFSVKRGSSSKWDSNYNSTASAMKSYYGKGKYTGD